MRTVKCYPEAWPLHTPFVIARGSRTEAKVVVVEIEENGVKGTGEATPYTRYGESEALVLEHIATVMPQLQQGLTREALQTLLPAGPPEMPLTARCGIWPPGSSTARWNRSSALHRSRQWSPHKRSALIHQRRWPAVPRHCGSMAQRCSKLKWTTTLSLSA